MQLQKNDHVRHTKVPGWGLGKVLQTSPNGYVDIQFSQAGHKRLKMESAPLQKVSTEQAEEHITSFLLESNQKPPTIPPRLQMCLQTFRRIFPKGFRDQRYQETQRNPRLQDQHRFLGVLSKPQLMRLLHDEAVGELRTRFDTFLAQTPLLFPKEKASARQAIQSQEGCLRFACGVFDVAFSDRDENTAFSDFCTTLESLEADKWAVATIFPFLADPRTNILIRPAACQKTAICSQTRLRYHVELNNQTYTDAQAMARTLFRQLIDLQPRDLLDIQAFISMVPHLLRRATT
ncbi:DUF3553 domain-containing protein [Desulfohalobium retbaense]|uniref:DUF3553 domain-containing protein n=1 Tax=Desulfohalobium retbaense (strain ATCC 49708 / DSM 5692 / JCM 16813 / HR100) TaxID=485915 RepID=C8X115_DESRD|nr:DUF3553 domain-containing protein [Desulfohalobium retbaense]ACV68112.1 hypothetical protein Dret_0821 [Desulfohalobium retbaense DSM 5692]